MGLCVSSSTCCNSQISNSAQSEQEQRALEDQGIVFVILGFKLPKCRVSLRDVKGVCVVVRENNPTLFYTYKYTHCPFLIDIEGYRSTGLQELNLKYPCWDIFYLQDNVVWDTSPLVITLKKLSVFHMSVLIQTPRYISNCHRLIKIKSLTSVHINILHIIYK